MRLVFGMDALVAKWVALRIPEMAPTFDFGPCAAIGVVDEHDMPIAGVVFHNEQPMFRSIAISCASTTPKWLTRSMIRGIMSHPFDRLKCVRVTSITARKNTPTRRFLEKFGFKLEGVARRGLGDDDAMLYGMLDTEWATSPWIKGLPKPVSGPKVSKRRRRQIAPQFRGELVH